MSVPLKIIQYPPRRKSAQSYKVPQWEEKRALITKLYRDDAKSLREVHAILARHDFHPTEAMIKKHIRKWDIDRKKKYPDMVYAFRLATERKKQGKETNFLIRGQVVSFEEVQQYFKRKNVHDLHHATENLDHMKSTTQIRPLTPRPCEDVMDPTEDHAADYAACIKTFVGLSASKLPNRWAHSSPVERFLWETRTLYQVPQFQIRNFRVTPKLYEFDSMVVFLLIGNSMLKQDEKETAFLYFEQFFSEATRRSRPAQAAPILIPWLFHLLNLDWHIAFYEVFNRGLSFLMDLTAIKDHQYPPLDHLALVFSLLRKVPNEEKKEVARQGLQVVADIWTKEDHGHGLNLLEKLVLHFTNLTLFLDPIPAAHICKETIGG